MGLLVPGWDFEAPTQDVPHHFLPHLTGEELIAHDGQDVVDADEEQVGRVHQVGFVEHQNGVVVGSQIRSAVVPRAEAAAGIDVGASAVDRDRDEAGREAAQH